MHQAHQTAPARTAHDHEGRGDRQRAPAQRVSPLPPGVTRQPGTVAAPGPRPAATLSKVAAAQAAATAEPWHMAILVPEPVPPSIKAARDFTTDTLLDWGLRGLIQDATLVVSELVTNALRHGARDGDGGIGHDRPELILWARDGYLASRWGWSMLGVHRKAVWALLGGAETGARRAAAPAVVASA